MADKTPPPSPAAGAPSPRAAVDSFKHAEKILARGDCEYAIRLLRDCCLLDPLNLRYRQALRAAEKKKSGDPPRAAPAAFLTTILPRLRMKIARWCRNHRGVLDYAERVLAANPYDISAHLALADAFDHLDATVQAIWALEEARRLAPENLRVLRTLARISERTERFKAAIVLWEMVRKLAPRDSEAADKVRGLSAKLTIDKMGTSGPVEAKDAATEETKPEQAALPQTADHKPLPAPPSAPPPPAPAAGPARAPGHALPTRVEQEASRLRARIEADPTNPRVYVELAAHYRRADLLEQASEVLRHGRAPTGEDFELVMELSDVDTERLRRALTQVSERLLERGQDEDLTAKRDRLLEMINTRELEWYRKKLARYPTEQAYSLEVGVRLYRARQHKEAIPHLQAARTVPAQRVRALLHIGYCFKELGNWDLARRALEDGLKELPREDMTLRREFLFELARGAADHGDLTTAVERGNELAFLDFNYRAISELLEEWRGGLQRA
jgi:tetratricopeptide (TPR) repeat protein